MPLMPAFGICCFHSGFDMSCPVRFGKITVDDNDSKHNIMDLCGITLGIRFYEQFHFLSNSAEDEVQC